MTTERTRGERFFAWTRRVVRRFFLFWEKVCGGIAAAIGNYEFEVEQEQRQKRLAELDVEGHPAHTDLAAWTGRHGPYDDQARFGPPMM